MTKITVEINDVLPDCVETAIDETKQCLIKYITEKDFLKTSEEGTAPCLSNDLDYNGSIHEIVDGSVPVYTADIEAAWFLHSRDLEESYENAGIGDNPRESGGTAGIYYYIYEKVAEWYHDHAAAICDAYRNVELPNKDEE